MTFGHIKRIMLLGGSLLLAKLARYLQSLGKYEVVVFSCKRQMEEVVDLPAKTFEDFLNEAGIQCFLSDDICRDTEFTSRIDDSTLAMGFGEVWTFDRATVERFGGRLLDFMGIPLPQYRGGAHYSWMIMRGDRRNACNLQLINEDMIQGVFDSGEIIKSRSYILPEAARIPLDYFEAAGREELDFLKEFLREVDEKKSFSLKKLDEQTSVYFPRLYTLKQGWINWSWNATDVVRFICAFDEPYKGASTFINRQRVSLKDCHYCQEDGDFHPFQSGLIYRIDAKGCYVAVVGGGVRIGRVLDENGQNLQGILKPGMRFYTPVENLQDAMLFEAVYDKDGIVAKK